LPDDTFYSRRGRGTLTIVLQLEPVENETEKQMFIARRIDDCTVKKRDKENRLSREERVVEIDGKGRVMVA